MENPRQKPNLRIVRFEPPKFLEARGRLANLPLPDQRQREIPKRFPVPGLELQNPAETGRGVVELAPFRLDHADVQVGVGVAGLEADGFLKMGKGLVVAILGHQGEAQVVLGPVVARRNPDRVAVERDVVPPRPHLEPGQDRQNAQAPRQRPRPVPRFVIAIGSSDP